MSEPDLIRPLLRKLSQFESLSVEQSEILFGEFLRGCLEPAQAGALLGMLAMRPVTADELAGAARVMRREAVGVDVPEGWTAVDTCGTGGDHAGWFNVSTCSAVVVAAAGHCKRLCVAKHGNRAVTSSCGSSQVLEQLGVQMVADPAALSAMLAEIGIAFLLAPNHHPAMRHAAPIRASLGFRTIFNMIGPLSNPAGVRRQVVGVWDPELAPVMADALVQLGVEHAWVVSGEVSPAVRVDELSPCGQSQVWEVKGTQVRKFALNPAELGLSGGDPDVLKVENAAQSEALVSAVLCGENRGLARDAVVLNAAAALVVGGVAEDMCDAMAQSQQTLDSGRGWQLLQNWKKRTMEIYK